MSRAEPARPDGLTSQPVGARCLTQWLFPRVESRPDPTPTARHRPKEAVRCAVAPPRRRFWPAGAQCAARVDVRECELGEAGGVEREEEEGTHAQAWLGLGLGLRLGLGAGAGLGAGLGAGAGAGLGLGLGLGSGLGLP